MEELVCQLEFVYPKHSSRIIRRKSPRLPEGRCELWDVSPFEALPTVVSPVVQTPFVLLRVCVYVCACVLCFSSAS